MINPAAALHATPHSGVFFATGGGISLLAELLTEPGASATVLEASVPYAEAALADQLGGEPDQACSLATARALAMAAWQRSVDLSQQQQTEALHNLFGFGCTAALATNRKKRGPHRAYLALQTLETSASFHVEFNKGVTQMGNRETEEAQITQLAWQLLERVLQIDLRAKARPELAPELNSLSYEQVVAKPEWIRLFSGESGAVNNKATQQPVRALLSGAFNPLHEGHLAMAGHAAQVLDCEVDFELCVANVDKPMLSYADLEPRCKQFTTQTLWLTRLPTFIEKARQFPGCTFVVGIDTLVRIGMPRYYATVNAMQSAFAELARLDNRFLVFGRASDEGFLTLGNSTIPDELRALCQDVPEDDFRMDISSSAIRRQQNSADPAED